MNMCLGIDQICEEARRKKAEAETRELLRKYNTLKAQLEALNQRAAAQ